MRARVLGVGLWGPGLEGWAAGRPVLAGLAPYRPAASVPPPPPMLPATERRRTGPVARLALAAAQEAADASGLDPAGLRSVFASGNGDGVVVGGILQALAEGAPGERVVSPTQFHNSVHNAVAGYWTIAHGSRQPATCLGARDWSWAAGLLRAMAEVEAGGDGSGGDGSGGAVLLVCYDHPLPPPLDRLRPTGAAFAAALVLGAAEGGGGPVLDLSYRACEPAMPPGLPEGLQALADGNAAARALPLLAALARGAAATVPLPYLDGRLDLVLHP